MNTLLDPTVVAGALQRVAAHFGSLGARIPDLADMAQRGRQLEKLEPGLLNEQTIQRPKDKIARQSRQRKVELFGNI